MNENKQKICDLLAEALRATRDHSHHTGIRYERLGEYTERTIVEYANGCTRVINVSMDSGTAMMLDILRHI